MRTALVNGRIYLGQEEGQPQFAASLLLDDNMIEAVDGGAGQEADKTIDLQGRTVVPGFNDSHLHLLGIGQRLSVVDLTEAHSIEEMVALCREHIETVRPEPGRFIVGQGWNQDQFAEGRMPDRRDLDGISTEHPIYLSRVCSHAGVCNTSALELAGIGPTTRVAGGEVRLGPDGKPNGLLTEGATDLVARLIPQPGEADIRQSIRKAMEYLVTLGITSVQTDDINGPAAGLVEAAYGDLCSGGQGLVRVHHQRRFMEPEALKSFIGAGNRYRQGDHYERTGPIKLFIDGSLGARTALMLAPYDDTPGCLGVDAMPRGQLDTMVAMAHEAGFQVVVHAIGDAGLEWVLGAFERVLEGGGNTLRHGVVHCQISNGSQLERIRQRGILVLAQPIFLNTDWRHVVKAVGERRAATSYAFGTMLRAGVPLSYGTDSPVENPNPLRNIYCAVTRCDLTGQPDGGYQPRERVSVAQAVDAYTQGSAYCSGDEDIKGCIRPGYLADLAVLDRDIFSCPQQEIKDAKVVMTIMDGKIVYCSPALQV